MLQVKKLARAGQVRSGWSNPLRQPTCDVDFAILMLYFMVLAELFNFPNHLIIKPIVPPSLVKAAVDHWTPPETTSLWQMVRSPGLKQDMTLRKQLVLVLWLDGNKT